ncbi:MAG TPA: hypothetical protein EYN66_04565 [Myxococcales bacterium]|nr:hypothetical protein [Myxococcales bacterium]
MAKMTKTQMRRMATDILKKSQKLLFTVGYSSSNPTGVGAMSNNDYRKIEEAVKRTMKRIG